MNVGAVKGTILFGLLALPIAIPLMVITVPAVIGLKTYDCLKDLVAKTDG